ncbi:uncharacterized protein LOC126891115 [Diabrotica virgifera virgifera]|uniref:Regulatory protein zeste n=1 Tax=Diabrotica virgifera virgifera TaxID=50390 RepID=A0ABM5L1D5_DIAVI|nr:uncharacterized protein LOC126891115 [Diabrotica virgifera virgifera]
MNSIKKKSTKRQLELMLEFLRRNRIVLTSKTKPLEPKKLTQLWQQFALEANAIDDGPNKTGEQWRHVFNEWKTNVKRKSRKTAAQIGGTGGGPNTQTPLTDIEEQLLEIISHIHLGDPKIMDTFDFQEENDNEPGPSSSSGLQPIDTLFDVPYISSDTPIGKRLFY